MPVAPALQVRVHQVEELAAAVLGKALVGLHVDLVAEAADERTLRDRIAVVLDGERLHGRRQLASHGPRIHRPEEEALVALRDQRAQSLHIRLAADAHRVGFAERRGARGARPGEEEEDADHGATLRRFAASPYRRVPGFALLSVNAASRRKA
jgi:hypothetical protein